MLASIVFLVFAFVARCRVTFPCCGFLCFAWRREDVRLCTRVLNRVFLDHFSIPTLRMSTSKAPKSVVAGALGPWKLDELPAPEAARSGGLLCRLGPSVVFTAAAIGLGEWVAGPSVVARHGGSLLWFGLLSLVLQSFLRLGTTRYSLCCGESISVGFCRTRPGPWLWIPVYAALEILCLLPILVSSLFLSAAFFGESEAAMAGVVFGAQIPDSVTVKVVAAVIFLVLCLPVFLKTSIQRRIQRVLAVKLALVLVVLIPVAVFTVDSKSTGRILRGVFAVGELPTSLENVVAGDAFNLSETLGAATHRVEGMIQNGKPVVTTYEVHQGNDLRRFGPGEPVPVTLHGARGDLVKRAIELAGHGKVWHRGSSPTGEILTVDGTLAQDGLWAIETYTLSEVNHFQRFSRIEDVPEKWRANFEKIATGNDGSRLNLLAHVSQKGSLPHLDWILIGALVGLVGAGGLLGSLLTQGVRDARWGMGARVAEDVAGGSTFSDTEENRVRWRSWLRLTVRDQVVALGCGVLVFVLPCLIASESAGSDSWSALSLGLPSAWLAALGVFVVVSSSLLFSLASARRWSDVFGVVHPSRSQQGRNLVVPVVVALFGVVALMLLPPRQILSRGVVGLNAALALMAFHTLVVNLTLLPRNFRPNWPLLVGLGLSGSFFLGITLLVLLSS